MSLRDWLSEGRLQRHKPSRQEVTDLLRVVERDLADAAIRELSPDRRFAIAYNAALQLATIALAASGFRTAGLGHHWITLHALPEVLGPDAQGRTDYLNSCRSKRNITDYDRAGEISAAEADELLDEARAFRADLLEWLKANHPHLITGSS